MHTVVLSVDVDIKLIPVLKLIIKNPSVNDENGITATKCNHKGAESVC